MMGSQINIFLSSVSARTYGVDSRDDIIVEANAVENDKGYIVCATLKIGIELAVAQSPQNSPQLNDKIATTASIDITLLKAVFAVNNADVNNIVKVHLIFDDDADKERERDKK